eukprot:COSAG02_NODE_3638_length_6442_cov_6.391297_5_plen_259_part_00
MCVSVPKPPRCTFPPAPRSHCVSFHFQAAQPEARVDTQVCQAYRNWAEHYLHLLVWLLEHVHDDGHAVPRGTKAATARFSRLLGLRLLAALGHRHREDIYLYTAGGATQRVRGCPATPLLRCKAEQQGKLFHLHWPASASIPAGALCPARLRQLLQRVIFAPSREVAAESIGQACHVSKRAAVFFIDHFGFIVFQLYHAPARTFPFALPRAPPTLHYIFCPGLRLRHRARHYLHAQQLLSAYATASRVCLLPLFVPHC